ncbi:MAG TPA: NADH-quinone oxidoreductase subunit NuoG [Xanthobacteraceae bacterium]|jgi:NADH-quinone oxidoreductase subunit G|nr:NADH-quinone oxidoreductase subunit NuoG [Xanthobacteraceae bacterium]
MATIHVDGRDYEVQPTDNLLHACLSHGLDIPYFCWHPALGSVGACRQCAVKEFRGEDDRAGRIVMSCMTPAADGTRLSIAEAEAVAFRKSIIEWLMTNHPHDCPVCEEGGECHLQDMTLMTGHSYRRYRFTKRTYRNQYLGPFVGHEMNRCIACYRCVRFYRDYAGGRDLDVYAAHNHVYFGRHEDGVLESEFSGNLVEVCPTGVFTDRTLANVYTRKWDLKGAPSVCVHCGLGCNTIPNARYGEVRRILNRYNGEVNRYFLCDRGRFGYGFVNGPKRIRRPLLAQDDGAAEPVAPTVALGRWASLLRDGRAIGIGSPRASLEANFALRALVGPERFHAGVADAEGRLLETVVAILRDGPAPAASLRQAEDSDAVLVLGEDAPNTAPRLALTLRQAVRRAAFALAEQQKIPHWQDAAVRDAGRDVRSPLVIATPDATRLDDIAMATLRGAPDDIARLGFAIAHAIDPAAPAVEGLTESAREQAERFAALLQAAARPLVVSGYGSGGEAVIRAAANVAQALRRTGRDARIVLTVPECNSLGLALMGGAPLSAAHAALRDGRARTLIVLENDLYRRADRASVDAMLGAAEHVVVLDHTLNETAYHADIVIPAGTFVEADGTFISNEGRAQRFFQLIVAEDGVKESWRWLNEAARAAGKSNARWDTLDDLITALGEQLPALAAIRDAAPAADFRIAGNRIRSAPHRYSGRTAIHADLTVHEPKPPQNPDAPYTNSMEGYYGRMPPALYPFFWAPSWNSVQALNKFQDEVGGALHGGDPGVRVIEPRPGADSDYAQEIPRPFARRDGEWLVVPQYRVFGSEELSALAAAVAERVTGPSLGLNPEDAAMLAVVDGDAVALELGGASHVLSAQIRPALPRGVAALSIGLPGLPAVALPAWARILPAPPELRT